MLETRVGLGTDRHRFIADRPLIIGGVSIKSDLGLDGHSDADVLCHAIIDALIGACKLGDIGDFFPETKEYKDAQSIVLLRKTVNLVTDKGWRIVNIDATVVTSYVKLSPYRQQIEESLSSVLGTPAVNVKFKSGNTLGFEYKEGISAWAICLLSR